MSQVPTSPDLKTPPDQIATKKAFSDAVTQELTDDETQKFFLLAIPIIRKWQEKFRLKAMGLSTEEQAHKMVAEFEDELKYECATKLKIYIRVDTKPLLNGDPPEIEVSGILRDHDIYKYGFDHEKKGYEVTKATDRGEAYLGERDKDAGKTQKKKESQRKSPRR